MTRFIQRIMSAAVEDRAGIYILCSLERIGLYGVEINAVDFKVFHDPRNVMILS